MTVICALDWVLLFVEVVSIILKHTTDTTKEKYVAF